MYIYIYIYTTLGDNNGREDPHAAWRGYALGRNVRSGDTKHVREPPPHHPGQNSTPTGASSAPHRVNRGGRPGRTRAPRKTRGGGALQNVQDKKMYVPKQKCWRAQPGGRALECMAFSPWGAHAWVSDRSPGLHLPFETTCDPVTCELFLMCYVLFTMCCKNNCYCL